MNIKTHIKDLLITNQGVIIPGFGGFISEYEPAAFDINENKFLPPSKSIKFRSDYTHQDTLLASYIAEKENINLNESKKLIDNFTENLKLKLKNGELISFPEIGSLKKDKKGDIIFNQTKETNLLTDSFGLEPLKSNRFNTINKSTISEKPIQKQKSNKKVILLTALSVVLIGLMITSWFITDGFSDFKFAQTHRPNNDTNLEPVLTSELNLDSIAKADSIKAIINQSIDENTDKKDALFYAEPKTTDHNSKQKYSTFYIIAGSFKKIENAEKFAKGIREKGFDTEIIESGKELIRISIFKYDNETEALKKLYKLRQESDLKSVWVLKEM